MAVFPVNCAIEQEYECIETGFAFIARTSHFVLEDTINRVLCSVWLMRAYFDLSKSDVWQSLVVHVDDIFAVGLKSRYIKSPRDELNHLVPVKNLEELGWFGGCHF